MVLLEGLRVAPSDEQVEPEEAREELNRVLASAEFRASPRRREMLNYLMEETLAGRGHALKGYSVGVSVFHRGEDFDAQADPVVRLEARRLRRDLDSYYVSEGRRNPLRISIPKGNYAPEVRRNADLAPAHAPRPRPAHEAAQSETATAGSTLEQPVQAAAIAAARPRWTKPASLATAFLVLVAILGAGLWVASRGRGGAGVLAGVENPSITVLPFDVVGSSQDDAFLAAGMADQIVTDLSRFEDFRIYLPTAGKAEGPLVEPIEAARRIGVDYVVAGSVASEGSKVRIAARLIEVGSGRVMWADNFDREIVPDSLLSVQGDIADAVSTALGQPYGVIKSDMTQRIAERPVPSMTSYECVLRGYSYRRNFAEGMYAPTLACLQAAVKRDPNYADAWAMLGWLYLDAGRFGMTDDIGEAYGKALDAASHAVSLDGRSILSLKALASIDHYLGNFEESERIQRRALALNPNDPDTLAQLGWRLAVRGKFEEGIPYVKRAIDRTINPPGWYFHLIAVDQYLKGEYAEMLETAKRSLNDESGIAWSLVAIADGKLGKREAAQEALERMAGIAPALAKDPGALYRRHGATDGIADALVDGLRQAGWTPPSGA